MSKTLITFKDGKITLHDAGLPLMENVRVVSMVGKGRRGKSSFMNAIVSYLHSSNQMPFQTSDGDEHCTKSIDAYAFPALNILLLDSKGLDYEDSRNDPALMLFLHQISDLMIFNDRQRLDNGALKLMEPICTFTNYIDHEDLVNNGRPRLAFRIADCEIKDTQKALQMLLTPYEDQYKSLRESIVHLFDPDIRLVKTEQIDRRGRRFLDEGQYMDILADSEYGFTEAIDALMALLPVTGTSSDVFRGRVDATVARINGSDEITVDKLDVVKLQAENDIRRWQELNVPPTLLTPIVVNGTQKSYTENVEPRKAEKRRILTAFTRQFKSVADEIREPFYAQLNTRLTDPITQATERSVDLARLRVRGIVTVAEMDRTLSELNSFNNSFSTIPDGFFTGYLAVYERVKEACADIYVSVKNEYDTWVQSIFNVVNESVASVRAEEVVEREQVTQICERAFANFDAHVESMQSHDVQKSNHELLEAVRDDVLAVVTVELVNTIRRRQLIFTMANKRMTSSMTHADMHGQIHSYDLVAPIYGTLVTRLNEYIGKTDCALNTWLTDVKRAQLKGFYLADNPSTRKIIANNTAIAFVRDDFAMEVLLDCQVRGIYFMTRETWETHIGPLYQKGIQKMVDKGLCSTVKALPIELQKTDDNIVTIVPTITNKYDAALHRQWKRALDKIFCQETVNGWRAPSLFTA
jgi:hypothetical protein